MELAQLSLKVTGAVVVLSRSSQFKALRGTATVMDRPVPLLNIIKKTATGSYRESHTGVPNVALVILIARLRLSIYLRSSYFARYVIVVHVR